jgi:hypothetical protein
MHHGSDGKSNEQKSLDRKSLEKNVGDVVDFYDLDFSKMFYLDKPLFDNLITIEKNIAEFEKESNIILKIRCSNPTKLFREYVCNSHNNCPFFCCFGPDIKSGSKICAKKSNLNHYGTVMTNRSKNNKRKRKQRLKGSLQQTLEQDIMVKEDEPIPKDVVKAAANVSGKGITYNQGFRAIKAGNTTTNEVNDGSYQLIVPYLIQFEKIIQDQRYITNLMMVRLKACSFVHLL